METRAQLAARLLAEEIARLQEAKTTTHYRAELLPKHPPDDLGELVLWLLQIPNPIVLQHWVINALGKGEVDGDGLVTDKFVALQVATALHQVSLGGYDSVGINSPHLAVYLPEDPDFVTNAIDALRRSTLTDPNRKLRIANLTAYHERLIRPNGSQSRSETRLVRRRIPAGGSGARTRTP